MAGVKAPPSLDQYTIVVFPDDNGTFVASVPAIEACYAMGRTRAEAMQELEGVFEMCAEHLEERHKELPADIQPETIAFATQGS